MIDLVGWKINYSIQNKIPTAPLCRIIFSVVL
jgi:hypothetical protein